ncbi:hypothetical protein P7K49_005914 [Saguinus oedipus]|uniref:Uncharacterized protein n=1 Tax=Saguinus oedipus TaxID=9490 RepID=A0ABQ9W0X5_SAGOE|nr:hypothetical protein P7K49_005914 [Saguinus oedipus]
MAKQVGAAEDQTPGSLENLWLEACGVPQESGENVGEVRAGSLAPAPPAVQRPPPSVQPGETEARRGRPRRVTRRGRGREGRARDPHLPAPSPAETGGAGGCWARAGGRGGHGGIAAAELGPAGGGRLGRGGGGGGGGSRGARPGAVPVRAGETSVGRPREAGRARRVDAVSTESRPLIPGPRAASPRIPAASPRRCSRAQALPAGTKAGVGLPGGRVGGSGRHGACGSAGSSPRAGWARGSLPPSFSPRGSLWLGEVGRAPGCGGTFVPKLGLRLGAPRPGPAPDPSPPGGPGFGCRGSCRGPAG